MEHNREKFGVLLKSIIGNLKSIIGPGLVKVQGGYFLSAGYKPLFSWLDNNKQ